MTKLEVLEMLRALLLANRAWLPDDYGGGDYVVTYEPLMRDIEGEIELEKHKQGNEDKDNA